MSQSVAGYEIGETLHRSRVSVVYRALGPDGQRVVIKTSNAEYPSAQDIARFRLEYEILERIKHPGVVRPIALRPHGRNLALVLEHVPGVSLEERLRSQPISLSEFLTTAITLADALAAIHDASVVHKDLNPSNILVHPGTASVKIVDFGIASVLLKEAQLVLNPQALEATLAYISPEQTGRMNRSLDYRTDLYSLGVIFYRMLTGRLPFVSDDPMEVIHQHIARPAVPPAEVAHQVPSTLSRIVLRLMAKTAEDRYQSAAGLRVDLERCLDGLIETGVIPEFPIAGRDVSSRFQIPEKLYGRKAESEKMLFTFKAVGAGRSALMLVAGYSGVGKSRLVNELQKPILERRGYFVSGKFDQYKRSVPFASLHEAFRDLTRQVLMETDEAVAEWRQRLLDAFGPNGQLIVDVIPEIELVVGRQQPVTELPPQATRHRFLNVFRSFVRVFCRPEHPLCLFLDDLQWVDSATLSWLEDTLPDPEIHSLFVIGAYRENEVSPSHPLMVTLDRLSKRFSFIEKIELQPLDEKTLHEFVADTLGQNAPGVQDISRLIYSKTRGNPFFVNQLLISLYERGALRFERELLHWVPDLEKIRAAEISDNVIELMVSRIRRLEAPAQEALALSSCVGSSFRGGLLAEVAEIPEEKLIQHLAGAVDLGLISGVGRSYEYRFVHDRVQQAAYSLLSEERAKAVRLRIGRRILKRSENPAQDDQLFDALQHFDLARDLIESEAERAQLVKLNLAAAVRARNSTAYAQALLRVKTAMELLPEASWQTPSDLALELMLERAACEHQCGNNDRAKDYYQRALDYARTDFDKARVYENMIHFYTDMAKFSEAYAVGCSAVHLFGVKLPSKFILPLFLIDIIKPKLRLGRRKVADLIELPTMSDERLTVAIRLMAAVAKAAYQVRPELCVAVSAKMVNLCLKHGNTRDCAIGYMVFGAIFLGGVLGQHPVGYEFGRLALSLVDKYDNNWQRAEVNFVVGYFGTSWVRPATDAEALWQTAYQAGVNSGDLFHAGCACSGTIQSLYMRGVGMDEIWKESDRFLEFLQRVNSRESIGTLFAVRQTIRNLRGETRNRSSFSDENFDEEKYLEELKSYGSRHFAHYYFVNKMQVLYLWREYEKAREVGRTSAAYLKDSCGMLHSTEHYFLDGLLCAQFSRPRSLRRAVRRFRRWARRCPQNFLAKALLLQAELARIKRQDDRATVLYDQAIETAGRYELRQVEALASELAGRFYASRGRAHAARQYLRDACYGYRRWGATAVAASVAEHHRDLFPEGIDLEEPLSSGAPTIVPVAKLDAELDVATILKSSAAISGEVQLRELLSKLVKIVIENAGADRGILLLPSGGNYLVQAEGTVKDEERKILQGIPLTEYREIPRSIVHFVVRSREAVVVVDTERPGQFSGDPYFAERRCRSALCAPLLHRGKLIGVIYLENSLTTGAFTKERTRLLQLLSGQFAISIENALVYEQLEEKVRERTAQLEARNRLIRQTFGRYLTEDVVEALLDAPSGLKMGGENREVTIMMTDLRGFSALSERLHPEQVVKLINNYLGVMTEVIVSYGGTIEDFIGDGIVVVFGAPLLRNDDPERAVACAVAMQLQMSRVNALNREHGLPQVEMGIGINTGEVVVGNIGSMRRAKYGVVGSSVNLASRIESYTIPGQILASARTVERVGALVEIAREFEVQPKGIEIPIRIFEITGIGGSHGLRLQETEPELIRLDGSIPIRYLVLKNKQAVGDAREGWLVRLSETEAEVRSPEVLEPFTDLEIRIEGTVGQVYAKVGEKASANGGLFPVRFTFMHEETRAFLRDRLRNGASSSAGPHSQS